MPRTSAPERPEEVVARLRAACRTGPNRSLEWRTEQLTRLRALLRDHVEDLAAALHTDLRKSRTEAYAAEIGFTIREIDHILVNLEEWLRPVPVALTGCPPGSTAHLQYDPLGVVLVMAPWNYPVQLLLVPIAGALAAGNAVVAKPSEVAPACSALLARLIPRYLDTGAVAVVEGGVAEATALLAQRFDHVFYTGNGAVGRIVMRAAAEHLTPVTLELGGKSPVFVDRGTSLAATATRLARAKFANAGQTCVAPDYVLTDPGTARALEVELARTLEKLFGTTPETSRGYGRIINVQHFDRIVRLLDSGRIAVGGGHDRESRFIAPTVLAEVPADSPVMQEEIFGPVLPIVEVSGVDEAITFINARDKPLAVYGFTDSAEIRRRLAEETASGSVVLGLPMAQVLEPGLPFGGVGQSGTGSYRGAHSLAAFSHRKTVLDVPGR
ncbi:aldehyde dehydrogenase family protein [Kitasatospora sp. DSM 101779]|uniref:Aldehyde dehydrogenase n=1 Tax=Kitasatospora sp. 152608 TaxID=1769566 RepID=A0A0U3BT54_9ACTN|nr:aldehyde dehydrogenase family protein [Kitasatospora sp. DSM 101779]ALT05958.1 aldehyde dehydrogenase [Kitasatospora sp. 152608]MCU7825056.1 aldehyde dehydrogenase family protein [Kitasatospora sp. DSM 101779]